MNDFRKEMASVSEDAVETINNLANQKWAIPFLGRRLNSACKDKFKDADTKGFRIELPWEGQIEYVSHNVYDDSTYVHELVVAVNSDGPAAGRIKSVHAHHWEYWHTSSNWQDHSESHTYEKREPNEKEVEQYKELLDGWTEGGSLEQIQALANALLYIVKVQGGNVRVVFGDQKEYNRPNYKVISISISREGTPTPVSIDINLDHLVEALDYSKIHVEAMHSQEDRRQLGICSGESWTLQYCLNFFDIFKTDALYQNIEVSLKAWLHKLYCSCSYYRDFMNIPQDVWWRDAWWRLQEVAEGKHRVTENKDLLAANCHDGDYYDKKPLLVDDPFCSLVGKLTMPYNQSMSPYSVDTAPCLTDYVKGQRVRRTFRSVIVNGIKWSICTHSCGQVAIDLAGSEEVEELKDGVVIIPYQIERLVVTDVHMLSEGGTKNWRKVVFAAPREKDLKPDSVSTSSSLLDHEDEECLTIHEGAFKGWQMLEEVMFERKSCRLRAYVFEGCSKLQKVDFGNNSCWIGDRCFQSCPSLVEVGPIKGSIGAETFRDCVSLKTIAMSYGMGESAFAGCAALETVLIEDDRPDDDNKKISSLPRRAFWGCASIKQIHLPKNIRILEEECLGSCSSDCVLHYEGDAFWFIGKNALPELKSAYYWGKSIRYEEENIVFSALLATLGIKREQYVETCLKYQCPPHYSISRIIGIIMGKKPPRRYSYHHHDDDKYYTPKTFEEAYEIFGSRLWDA